MGGQRSVSCAEIVGSLCARGYKGIGEQYVSEGKLVVMHYETDIFE